MAFSLLSPRPRARASLSSSSPSRSLKHTHTHPPTHPPTLSLPLQPRTPDTPATASGSLENSQPAEQLAVFKWQHRPDLSTFETSTRAWEIYLITFVNVLCIHLITSSTGFRHCLVHLLSRAVHCRTAASDSLAGTLHCHLPYPLPSCLRAPTRFPRRKARLPSYIHHCCSTARAWFRDRRQVTHIHICRDLLRSKRTRAFRTFTSAHHITPAFPNTMADVAKSSAPEQPEKVDGAAAAADSTAPAAAAADDDVKMDDAPSSVPKDGASEKTAATEGKYFLPCTFAALHALAPSYPSFYADAGAITRLLVGPSTSPTS